MQHIREDTLIGAIYVETSKTNRIQKNKGGEKGEEQERLQLMSSASSINYLKAHRKETVWTYLIMDNTVSRNCLIYILYVIYIYTLHLDVFKYIFLPQISQCWWNWIQKAVLNLQCYEKYWSKAKIHSPIWLVQKPQSWKLLAKSIGGCTSKIPFKILVLVKRSTSSTLTYHYNKMRTSFSDISLTLFSWHHNLHLSRSVFCLKHIFKCPSLYVHLK